jgi:hypothetical protein
VRRRRSFDGLDRPRVSGDHLQQFERWTEFFSKGVSRSQALLARPLVNVEAHYADEPTVCSILPLQVSRISLPQPSSSSFQVTTEGDLECALGLVKLSL